MKKWMIGAFWGLLVLPNLIWPFAKNFIPETGENTENRVMAALPTPNRENFSAYPKAVEDYINDHAAFRSQLLSLNAGINLGLLRSVDNTEVILGKEDWYFYNGGNSIADYRGTNLFSKEELELIAIHADRTRRYFESQGIPFVMLLAPNKEEIYGEDYLPDCYDRLSESTRYDQVRDTLSQAAGVTVIAPREYFKEHPDRLWYFKTDTHWNVAGGFVAGQDVIAALGGTPVSIDDTIVTYDYRGPGDLALLFHMPNRFLEDYFCTVTGYLDDVDVETSDLAGNGMVIRTEAATAPDPRRVAVLRDSFADVMRDRFSRYFQHVDYYHWQGFERFYLEENKPDALVYEIVEREYDRLITGLDSLVPEDFH